MILLLSTKYKKNIASFILYILILSGTSSWAKSYKNLPYDIGNSNNYIHQYKNKNRNAENTFNKNRQKVILPGATKIFQKGGNEALNNNLKDEDGGPSQPEMSEFKPVGADNMVDLFTGDFSYNIPLLDVGGYPVNIFYNSGITMDQEASWVGLGWNINPGSITRNMRGIPDDFNGSDFITKSQYTKPDNTYGVNAGASLELFGFNTSSLNFNAGIFFNNQRGLGLEAGISPSIGIGACSGDDKTAPLNFGWGLQANSQTGGSQTFSITLKDKEKNGMKGALSGSISYQSRVGLQSLHLDAEMSKSLKSDKTSQSMKQVYGAMNPTMSSSISFAYPAITPSIKTKLYRENYSIDLGTGVDGWGAFAHLRLAGYYASTRIRHEDIITSQPAYGMLYMQNGNDDKNAMLDFNRLNDGVYTPNAPTIAMPAYTYDVFSISGEGTGGSFRAYRGDLGFVRDAFVETQNGSGHLGVEIGGGAYGKGGVNANLINSPSSSGNWNSGNLAQKAMAFKKSYGGYQAVYFKNPGEKSVPDQAYQNAIGGEDMVRLKMTNLGIGSPTLVPSFIKYGDTRIKRSGSDLKINDASVGKARDKRTQVISFLTAEEADRAGFNTKIPSVEQSIFDQEKTKVYGCNTADINLIPRHDNNTSYRKMHHISEIDVLQQDGRRYVYGIPVYNIKQTDITFNKTGNNSDKASQLINYNASDTTTEKNIYGKDGYVEREEMPAYTHSFLLTALLSPNYVDVKMDGITDDDMGDAIKFNYGKFEDVNWRTPVGDHLATYSEGLKDDANDDKAHIIYGKREMWYLYSIESKNLVARFYVLNDRKDSRSVVNEDGLRDENQGARQLSKISLFSKADLVKESTTPGYVAKPIKTVHFNYDYSLCPGTPTSGSPSAPNIGAAGKLTLKSLYFTYNGNEGNHKNYYRFNYPGQSDIDKNPAYNFKSIDRWGNYKPATHNQGSLANTDFPYVEKDKQYTDKYAAAWTMNDITLPSGAHINVDYEADDYAYVQDRRSCEMYQIIGFGNTNTPDKNKLHNTTLYQNADDDNDYIYIQVPRKIDATSPDDRRRQIEEWYLGNMKKSKQIFMKVSVMPKDEADEKSEMIPLYADIDDIDGYDVVQTPQGEDPQKQFIYIKVKKLASHYTPMVQYSLQFLTNFLPAKAYTGYDVSNNGTIKSIVKALGGLYVAVTESFRNGMAMLKKENKCRYTEVNKSFIRLTNPYYKKFGGGLRVKKIEIYDNWNKMTQSAAGKQNGIDDGMGESKYGQEYFYTKNEPGLTEPISSGVASWEPGIGGEENPHREMMSYFNKNTMGPYNYSSVELPLGEMFYPSPSVGYSRVEVKSIHRDTVKNAPGIQVSEFYTTREFPTKSNYTPLEEYGATDKYTPNPILQLLKIDITNVVALSQGFKIDLNDMNGKMKRQSSYSSNNLIDPITYTENFYNIIKSSDNTYKFNHTFPVISKPDGTIDQTAIIGRDIELMTDFRQHKLETITTSANFNIDVINGCMIPIPVFTFFSPVQYEADIFRSAAVLKVVNHFSMVDSVVTVDKGSMVSTKNLVYDAETGNPLLTRTNNEHNKLIYGFTYPAHWAYSGMDLAYKNIDVRYTGLTFRYGRLETSGVDMSLFESGDEIYVYAPNDKGPDAAGPCDPMTTQSVVTNGQSQQVTGYFPLIKSSAKRIWAISTARTYSLTPEMFFIDSDGNPYTAKDVSIRIIRSGKRNMLGSSVGNLTMLNNPVKEVAPNINKLVFADETHILQTSASTYSDRWRVDNVLYENVTPTTYEYTQGVQTFRAPLTAAMDVENQVNGSGNTVNWLFNSQRDNIDIRRYKDFTGGYSSNDWMLFDMSAINVDPYKITQATLHLHHHGVHYLNNHFYHDETRSHRNYSSFYPNNEVVIQRMRTSWGANNNFWKALYGNDNFVDPNNQQIISRTGVPTSHTDASVDVTSIVREMIKEKNICATGLRLSIKGSSNTGVELRQCYANNSVDKPYIEISVADCNSSYTGYNNRICNVIPGQTSCVSKFDKKSINPYVEGNWGNWRPDTSFVYYTNRTENNPSATYDMRTAGTIGTFKPFWKPDATLLKRNYDASNLWVWNSAITQYNRKGYDIENKDPLGRYNSSIYGYNQQLPVAVINNSRHREAIYDGFEDYTYQSNACIQTCQPQRHFDFGNISPYISNTQHHSGLASLRVADGVTMNVSMPLITEKESERGYYTRVRVDSTAVEDTIVHSKGFGFKGKFYNYDYIIHGPRTNGCDDAYTAARNKLNSQDPYKENNPPDQLSAPAYRPLNVPNGISRDKFTVRWKGLFQPQKSGFHRFLFYVDDGIDISINIDGINQNISPYQCWRCRGDNNYLQPVRTKEVWLKAGYLYEMTIDYFENLVDESLRMEWSGPGHDFSTLSGQVYAPGQDTTGSLDPKLRQWCSKLDSIQVRESSLTDNFSPIPGKKMILSAWVKEDGEDCKCITYTNNNIYVSFTGSPETYSFKPTGSIIEGWQRYESVFDIPIDATMMKVGLNNGGNKPNNAVYFDDVRMHPFNANMKGFVYNPVNLRLTGELDENNYTTFYEYDDDGTLTRVKKETERGIKTITETRSALQQAID